MSLRSDGVIRRRAGWLIAAVCACLPVVGVAQSPVLPASDGALAALLQNASVMNRLPADLIAYRASVETEVDVLFRREDGTETVGTMEQLASTLRWTRAGTYEQHVLGFRSQQAGLSISMMVLQTGWLNPSLYGNRLRALSSGNAPDSAAPRGKRSPLATARAARARRTKAADTIAVIHPLAVDRDRYYRFSRGDTLVTLQSAERRIPIVRVHVEPRADISDTVAIFIGDIDLDASRGTLVRMRGYFAKAGVARRRGILMTLVDALAFVEFENGERLGKYWLPAVQRIELQAMSPLFGDGRAVVRIVSRFPTMAINDTTLDSATLARADSLRLVARRRLRFASGDSLAKFSAWTYKLGAITTGMYADDFDDIGPDRLRQTGAPRLDLSASRASDVVHFNRVEGLYTGLGVKLALRDVAPGTVVRANAGWAWSEGTARGRVALDRTRGAWTMSLRAGRSLDITNDFRSPVDSGDSFLALSSTDPYDYVDRRSAAIGVTRLWRGRRVRLRGEFGVADDRQAVTTLVRGLYGRGRFLPNRGVDEGGYRRTALSLEWNPTTDAILLRPSVSTRAFYERGDGTLAYQRAELRAIAVRLFGPYTWLLRGDAGAVLGRNAPPQQLFELGSGQGLPGYDNKEFAGTRAAVLRTAVLYTSPFLARRIHLTRSFWLPGLSPGLSAGVESGWADAPGEAARQSVLRLGVLPDSNGVGRPVSRTTGGIRTTVNVGVRFFSGNLFVGYARAIDHRAPWRFQLGSEF